MASSSNPSATPSSSQAMVKRNADTTLMLPPPPPVKRIKRPTTVLDEDTYTDALSHIIARDFFPGLLETQTQQEYLDALDSRDREWIADAERKLTAVMTPRPGDSSGTSGTSSTRGTRFQTPGWETPRPDIAVGARAGTAMSEAGDDDAKAKATVNLSLSLGAFQAKYTSEDNESFNALLDRQSVDRAAKNSWVWNKNKLPSKGMLLEHAKEQKRIAAAKNPTITSGNGQLILRKKDDDKRPAQLDHKHQAPKNGLMFTPDSIEDTHETVAAAAEAASLMPPKAVSYANTRMPQPSLPASEVPPSPSMSAIDAAIAGRPRPTESEPGYDGSETPGVAGYKFVDAEPAPHELLHRNRQQQEDTSSATLRLLSAAAADAHAAGPNPFTIKEASAREALHHRIVDKNSKSKRPSAYLERVFHADGIGRPRGTPTKMTATPRFSSAPKLGLGGGNTPRRADMTPAAQRLLESMGASTPRQRDGLGGAFGIEKTPVAGKKWMTPTPKLRRKVAD